ncbi:MAG: hypothetical protein IIC06_09645 [Proteobacteria bacterium]|nr:hypothetical protein [Pseudomonadota bacterium]
MGEVLVNIEFFTPVLDNNRHQDLKTLAAHWGLVTAELKTTLNNVVSSYSFDGSSGVSRHGHASFTRSGPSIK